jgi:signal transduction histidine kinase
VTRLLREYLPHGNTLDDPAWHKRHTLLQWVLALHLPALFLFALALHHRGRTAAEVLAVPLGCLVAGRLARNRRLASFCVTAGLVYCSAALVGFSRGSIEAHFHFFIMIGFIALYQDWVPFLCDIAFTVLSHSLGSIWQRNLIFNHPAGQTSPWVWSAIHAAAVLAACVGVVVFWRTTEQEQQKSLRLAGQLADAELTRRRFTSELLVNLARRNQSLLYRQLDLINQLEHQEKDPDALGGLFRVDHLATRIRRNAESLLVLSGEEPARTWGQPVPLLDAVRAAIAETEDLDRVVFAVDEHLAVFGHAVADLTHLLAELVENAVRFSPPEASVIVRTRPYLQVPGAQVLTVEDWGVGLPADELARANELLAHPQEVDLAVSRQLGLHVVARLAQRYRIAVSLTPTPGCGATAVVVLPPQLFAEAPAAAQQPVRQPAAPAAGNGHPAAAAPAAQAAPEEDGDASWLGWWAPAAGGQDEAAAWLRRREAAPAAAAPTPAAEPVSAPPAAPKADPSPPKPAEAAAAPAEEFAPTPAPSPAPAAQATTSTGEFGGPGGGAAPGGGGGEFGP